MNMRPRPPCRTIWREISTRSRRPPLTARPRKRVAGAPIGRAGRNAPPPSILGDRRCHPACFDGRRAADALAGVGAAAATQDRGFAAAAPARRGARAPRRRCSGARSSHVSRARVRAPPRLLRAWVPSRNSAARRTPGVGPADRRCVGRRAPPGQDDRHELGTGGCTPTAAASAAAAAAALSGGRRATAARCPAEAVDGAGCGCSDALPSSAENGSWDGATRRSARGAPAPARRR